MELTRKIRQHDDDLLALYELVERLEGKVDVGFEQVDARFEQVDARFEQVDAQVGGIRTLLTEVDGKLDVLLQRLEIRPTE
jgi:hypothetical protein